MWTQNGCILCECISPAATTNSGSSISHRLRPRLYGYSYPPIMITYLPNKGIMHTQQLVNRTPTQTLGDPRIYRRHILLPNSLFLFSNQQCCPLIVFCLQGWSYLFKNLWIACPVPALPPAQTYTSSASNTSDPNTQLMVLRKTFFWWVGSSTEITFTAPTSGLSAMKTHPPLLQDILHFKLFSLGLCSLRQYETSEVASEIQVATGHVCDCMTRIHLNRLSASGSVGCWLCINTWGYNYGHRVKPFQLCCENWDKK